jgi:hypothetical protein
MRNDRLAMAMPRGLTPALDSDDQSFKLFGSAPMLRILEFEKTEAFFRQKLPDLAIFRFRPGAVAQP